jgi:hypothetical protein
MVKESMANIGAAQEAVDRASDHVPEASAAEWYLMEGVAGVGPRPDWLLSKYGSAVDQAKSYNSLRQALGAQQGAPEQYEYGELAKELDLDSKALKEFQIYAKENRLSQEAFERTMKTYVEYEQGRRPDIDQEIAKLGPGGIEKVKTVQTWAKNNLSADALKALEVLPVKAEVVNMLDELRQKAFYNQTRIPGSTDPAPEFRKLSVQEVESEMMANYNRYQNDVSYRETIRQKFEQAVG